MCFAGFDDTRGRFEKQVIRDAKPQALKRLFSSDTVFKKDIYVHF